MNDRIVSLGRTRAIVRLALGMLLTVAGLGKIPILGDFTQTIVRFGSLSPELGAVVAVALISVEIITGTGLLIGYRICTFAAVAALLFAGFAAVVASAILRGQPISCHCFGVLPLQPGNRIEFVLDVLLFDCALVAVMLYPPAKGSGGPQMLQRIPRLSRYAVILIFVQVVFVGGIVSEGRGGEPIDTSLLVRFAEAEAEGFTSEEQHVRLLMIGDLRDFGCEPCFEDFLALCDALRASSMPDREGRIAFLMRHEDSDLTLRGESLHYWATETGIDWALASLPDSVATQIGVQHAGVFLLDGPGTVRASYTFPLGDRVRSEIVETLERAP